MKSVYFALAFVLTLPSHTALATENATDKSRQSDRLEELMEYGEHLSQTCVSCHALTQTKSRIPVLAGWPRNELIIRLNAFKNRDLKNNVMTNIASAMGQLDILAVATYFSSLKRPTPPALKDPPSPKPATH